MKTSWIAGRREHNFSKFESNTKLKEVVNTLKAKAAVQGNLYMLKNHAGRKFIKFGANATWRGLTSCSGMLGSTNLDPVHCFGLLYKGEVSANWSGSS